MIIKDLLFIKEYWHDFNSNHIFVVILKKCDLLFFSISEGYSFYFQWQLAKRKINVKLNELKLSSILSNDNDGIVWKMMSLGWFIVILSHLVYLIIEIIYFSLFSDIIDFDLACFELL